MKKIKSIEIKNSPFYDDFRLEFSEKLNCIMGGRGAGKTTLLYFLKAALQKTPNTLQFHDNLLRSNLGPGTITVEIEGSDNITYNIIKTVDEQPQPFLLPSLDFTSMNKIFGEIECDFYEAGRIEEIGRSSHDRLELIDKKIRPFIREYFSAIEKVRIELQINAQDLKSFNRKLAQFDDVLNQYSSAEEDFEFHKSQKPYDIDDKENSSFEEADRKEKLRRDESRFFNRAIDMIKEFQNEITESTLSISEYVTYEVNTPENYQNVVLMFEGFELISTTIKKINSQIQDTLGYSNSQLTAISELFIQVLEIHEKQQSEFVQLKQRFEQNREYINKYNILSKRVSEKALIIKDREEFAKKKNKLTETRKFLVTKLNVAKRNIFKRRLEAVKQLNASFNKEVVITLVPAGIKDEYIDKLRVGLKGSGLQYNILIPRITEIFSPDIFAEIIQHRDWEALAKVPSIDEFRAKSIINALYETDLIYEIECVYCDDLPEFKLKIADDSGNMEENYRKTDELSMGQRCTTVLPIIFAVSTNPLIIDQPEDNLDNRYITQSIHEIIREQKHNRQLIFITHNPNIPVLSDADKNIFLEYENRKSKLKHIGSVNDVKDDIVKLLEGGAKAFEYRMEIYGYEK